MTIYLVISCVVGVIGIYLYGRREGVKSSELEMISESNERLNEFQDVKANIGNEVSEKLNAHSGNGAAKYWMSSNGAKKSGNISSTDKTKPEH